MGENIVKFSLNYCKHGISNIFAIFSCLVDIALFAIVLFGSTPLADAEHRNELSLNSNRKYGC
jgi:hypothetical protein